MNHDCRTSKKFFITIYLPANPPLPYLSYTPIHSLSNFSNTIQNVSKCPEAGCNRLQIRKKESQVWNKQRRQSQFPSRRRARFSSIPSSLFFPPRREVTLHYSVRAFPSSLRLVRGEGGTSFFPSRFFLFFHRFPPPTNQRGNQKSHDMTNFAAQQRGELHIFNVKPTFSTLLRSSDNGIRLEFHGYHCHESSYLEPFTIADYLPVMILLRIVELVLNDSILNCYVDFCKQKYII